MPITAYSKEAAREIDLEQWLTLNNYSIKNDPLLERMRSSYLYSLDWRDVQASNTCAGYRGSFFNIMLEFPREAGEPERVTVALEYQPSTKVLRVVTMT